MDTILSHLRREYADDPKEFEKAFYTMKASAEVMRDLCKEIKFGSFCALLELLDDYIKVLEELLLSRKLPEKEWREITMTEEQVKRIALHFSDSFGPMLNRNARRQIFLKVLGWDCDEIRISGPIVILPENWPIR